MKLPHQNIKVKVDSYDEEQKKKLLTYPTSQQIKVGYRNYEELGRKIGKSLSDLEDFITFNGISIATPADIGKQDLHITERVGESIGLSVVNRIHSISEADWDRIPETKGLKVFDYQLASDGTSIIQVETKGSSVNDNNLKPSTVSNHKSSIIEKKVKIANLESVNAYPYTANLRYGAITVLDCRYNSTVRCLLLDPDPGSLDMPPAKLRLINRINFLCDWMSFISPRSQMTAALSTRVADLRSISNPFELDNVPLLKGIGEPFDIIPTPDGMGETLGFLSYKSRVKDGPSCGIVTQISNDALFFLGIRDKLAVLSIKQDFDSILSLKVPTETIPKTVNCVFHKSRFERLKLPKSLIKETEKGDEYFWFSLKGILHYSQEGLVFGVLPISNTNA
jgi:hypothetical protein